MRPPRVYTVAEANALVPTLEALTAELRERLHQYKFAAEQVQDLRRMHGDAVGDGDHPDHGELKRHAEAVREHQGAMNDILARVGELGVELKDPVNGLVDFYAKRGDDLVYLCWKSGEPEVRYWHTLTGGFAGRQPVSEL